MSSFIRRFLSLLILLSAPLLSPAWAQETGEPPFKPSSLILSLKDVVEGTLRNNVAIAVEEFNSRIREQDITVEESIFDPVLDAELSKREKTNQVSSAFASPDKARNRDLVWDLALSQRLVTGAEYELSFNNDKNRTNSNFAGLNPQYTSELVFSISQPLLKGAGIDNNKREIYIAKNNLEVSDYDFQSAVIDTISDVENNYWDLVFSIEDLKVKQKSLQRARDLERRVRAQVEVGTLAPLEILQAQADVADREEDLLGAEDLIKDNEDTLKNLMNIPFDSLDADKDVLPSERPAFNPADNINVRESVREALTKRPDYLSRKKQLENDNIRLKYSQNQLYPTVDLFGSLGLNGISGEAVNITQGTVTGRSQFGGGYDETLANLFSTKYFLWEFGLKFNYPIGNRAAKSRVTQSRLTVAQTLLDLKDLEKKIVLEVREAARQIRTEIKRVHATRAARRLAEEQLNAEEKKFEVGLSTSFNVLEFQEDLAEAQSNEIQSLIDYNKSHIRLRQAVATTLEAHGIKMSSDS